MMQHLLTTCEAEKARRQRKEFYSEVRYCLEMIFHYISVLKAYLLWFVARVSEEMGQETEMKEGFNYPE